MSKTSLVGNAYARNAAKKQQMRWIIVGRRCVLRRINAMSMSKQEPVCSENLRGGRRRQQEIQGGEGRQVGSIERMLSSAANATPVFSSKHTSVLTLSAAWQEAEYREGACHREKGLLPVVSSIYIGYRVQHC